MKRLAVLLAVVSSAASAGEAAVRDEFTIHAPFASVTAWLDAHAAECREAINVELLEQDGEVYKLRRENGRGVFVWRQRERIERRPTEWRMRTALVDCLEGGIARLDGHVVIVPSGASTKITAESAASVAGIKSRDLEFDLKSRARRLRRLMEESIR